jgi:hypothetical protein
MVNSKRTNNEDSRFCWRLANSGFAVNCCRRGRQQQPGNKMVGKHTDQGAKNPSRFRLLRLYLLWDFFLTAFTFILLFIFEN